MSEVQQSRPFKPTHLHADGDRYEVVDNSAIAVAGDGVETFAVANGAPLVVYFSADQRCFVTTFERFAERFTAIPPRVVKDFQIDMPTMVKMRDIMMEAGGALQTFPDGYLLDVAQAMEDIIASTQGLMMSAIQRMQWTRFVALCRAADAMRLAAKSCNSAFLLHDPQAVNG